MSFRGERSGKGEKNGGFFRSFVSSIGSSGRQLNGSASGERGGGRHDKPGLKSSNSTSSSPGGTSSSTPSNQRSPDAVGTQVKHHSFTGHLPFSRGADEHSGHGKQPDAHQSILSKRPSLIVPFSNSSVQNNGAGGGGGAAQHDPEAALYMDDFQAPISKSGVLIKQANHFKTWKKRLMVLKGHSLFYYVSGTVSAWRACDVSFEGLALTVVACLAIDSRAKTLTREASFLSWYVMALRFSPHFQAGANVSVFDWSGRQNHPDRCGPVQKAQLL